MNAAGLGASIRRNAIRLDHPIFSGLGFALLALALLAASGKGWKSYLAAIGPESVWLCAVPMLIACATAVPFFKVRYGDFVPILRVTARLTTAGMLVALIFEPPDIVNAIEAARGAYLFTLYGYPAALILCVAGLMRPGFMAPVALYIGTSRHLAIQISGIYMSVLDIHYLLEMATFVGVFGCLSVLLLRGAFRAQCQQNIAFIAFGLHLANYFWSGVAKLYLGPAPWSWIVENKTHALIPFALAKGTLPFGQWPAMVQTVYDFIETFILPINIWIVLAQLFAIFAVVRRSWFIAAAISFDILHVGIMALSGILFWPWIWNNLTLIVAARKTYWSVNLPSKLVCVFTILLCWPKLGLNPAAALAWWDTADARQSFFEAITDHGPVAVPASFFNGDSYGISQGFANFVELPGQYGRTIWNSAYDRQRGLVSGQCVTPPEINPVFIETPEQRKTRLDNLTAFIRLHHRTMLEREKWLGRWSYYFRLHHHPSNPLLFGPWNATSLKDVRGYNIVLESICHSLDGGVLQRRVVARDEVFVDVEE